MSDEGAAADGERYWAYREQVARIPRDFGYVAADPLTGKPVPFDGYRPGAEGEPGTLLHAVGPHWAAGLIPDGRRGTGRLAAVSFMLDLAERQLRAAGGRAIEWHAASAGLAAAAARVLSENGLAGQLTVVHTPGRAGAVATAARVRGEHRQPAEEAAPPSAGVFWGDRREDAYQCARRYLRMLEGLGAAGLPGPLGWHAAVIGREHPVPLVAGPHGIAQLLLAGGQYTNATGELVPELGYRLNAATAGDEPAVLTVRCGISAGHPGVVNSAVLTRAPGGQARGGRAGWPAAIAGVLAGAWEPDGGSVTDGPDEGSLDGAPPAAGSAGTDRSR